MGPQAGDGHWPDETVGCGGEQSRAELSPSPVADNGRCDEAVTRRASGAGQKTKWRVRVRRFLGVGCRACFALCPLQWR